VSLDLYYRVSVSAGSAAYDLSHDLTGMTIEEDEAKPNLLSVELSDPYKVLSHALQEGMEVEVDLGYAEDHCIIFRGRIYKVDSDFPQEGLPTIKFSAYDKSMDMGLRKRNRPWTEMALSEIVQEIGGVYFNSDVQVDLLGDPRFSGNGIRQQDETDLAFLLRLARRYGAEMFVITDENTDTLHFESQYGIMNADPEFTLYHGRCGASGHLISFQAGSNVSDIQLPRVFSGIEYESGEPTEATTAEIEAVGDTEDLFFDDNLAAFSQKEPERAAQLEALLAAAEAIPAELREELGGQEREPTPGFASQEELDTRAENQFSTSLLGMRGSGTTPGNQRIRAQANIRIADVGGRFSGIWYLSQVRHVLSDQGYLTEIQCQR
jgi:phage protein D